MSTIMNFAIFPIDKGEHIGEYVSKVVEYIKVSGLNYEFSPMGTIIEAETVPELLNVIEHAYKIMDPISERIYCVMNMDSNKKNLTSLKRKETQLRNELVKFNYVFYFI